MNTLQQPDPVFIDLGKHLRQRAREEARDAEIETRANAIFTRMKHAPTPQDVMDAIGYIQMHEAAQMATAFARQDRTMLGVAVATMIENAFGLIAQSEAIRQVERIEREAGL